jgi:hypothetical protein
MMLKKTLHTAVAAIAVSTICLPTAEAAKKDLVLNFDTVNIYEVSKRTQAPKFVNGGPAVTVDVTYSDGVYEFENKTLAHDKYVRLGVDGVSGEHVVCDAGDTFFFPIEESLILQGGTPSNSLTLDTVSMEDSKDLSNPNASGICVAGSTVKTAVINYQLTDATGTWSCSYIQSDSLYRFVDLQAPPVNPAPERPFESPLYFTVIDQTAANSSFVGSIMIPRTTCQQ